MLLLLIRAAEAQSRPLGIDQATNRINESVVKIPSGFQLQVENGGTLDLSAATLVPPADRGLAQRLSAAGGNNGEKDWTGKTPDSEGQIGVAYYGNKTAFLYFSGSTKAGDWLHEFCFPTGLAHIGSVASMDPNNRYALWHFNGNPANYSAPGDSILITQNWSNSSKSSGTGYGCAVMGPDAGSGHAEVIDLVGCAFMHVPVNRVPGLIPGNAMLVFNTSPHMKGLAVCSPGISGFDPGNYSVGYFDFANKLFRVPYWVAGKYQPADTGWQDAFTVSPQTGNATVKGTLAVGGHVSSSQQRWSVHKSGSEQAITAAAWTEVTWDAEAEDEGGIFASNLARPGKAGHASMVAVCCFESTANGERLVVAITKNGTRICEIEQTASAAGRTCVTAMFTAPCNGTTDAFGVQVYRSLGTSVSGAAPRTYFQGVVQ